LDYSEDIRHEKVKPKKITSSRKNSQIPILIAEADGGLESTIQSKEDSKEC
jgi:hypothetical protein